MRSQLLDLGFEVPVRTYGFGETYEREQQGADVNNNYVNGKMRCKSSCTTFGRLPVMADLQCELIASVQCSQRRIPRRHQGSANSVTEIRI